MNTIEIHHEKWRDKIILIDDKYFKRSKNYDTGIYEICNDKLILYWTNYNPELFIKKNNSEAYELSCYKSDLILNTTRKLAIVVCFRNRYEHLSYFLNHFEHLKLHEKNIIYSVYVINQNNNNLFNRGALFNIGFDILKDYFDYFVFHDVDLLPIKSDYSYSNNILHLSKYVSQFEYKPIYYNIFGGVVKIPRDTYQNINGFSNKFEGWGGEDDLIRRRIDFLKYKIDRQNYYYESLPHAICKKTNLSNNGKILQEFKDTYNKKDMMDSDGVNQFGKTFNYIINDIKKLDDTLEYYMIDVDFDSIINGYKVDVFANKNIMDKYLTIIKELNTNNINSLVSLYKDYKKFYIPEISIILPIHKENMNATIKSILDQSYKNFELIIIFDVSFDIKNILSDSRIIYIKEEQFGVPKALNIGLEHSKGKYITWILNDILYDENSFFEMKTALDLNSNSDFIGLSFEQKTTLNLEKILCFMCTKKICDKVGLFDVERDQIADFDYILRILKHNNNVLTMNENNLSYVSDNQTKKLIINKILESSLLDVNFYCNSIKHCDNIINRLL